MNSSDIHVHDLANRLLYDICKNGLAEAFFMASNITKEDLFTETNYPLQIIQKRIDAFKIPVELDLDAMYLFSILGDNPGKFLTIFAEVLSTFKSRTITYPHTITYEDFIARWPIVLPHNNEIDCEKYKRKDGSYDFDHSEFWDNLIK